MKKIICVMLCLAMLCCIFVLPVNAQANKSKHPLYKEPDRSYCKSSGMILQSADEADVKMPIGLIAELPDEEDLKSATTVTISNSVLAELLEDSGFTRLSGSKFYQEELNYIESLNLDESGISSLSGVQYFKNLTEFSFNYCDVSSVSPLKSLTKLVYLSFVGNNVKSISDLSSLVNLEYLDVSYNELSSISAVSSMKNLVILSAQLSPKITALPTLTNCKNLAYINMSLSGVTSISKLSGLSKLEYASFASCKITGSFPSLSGMSSLTRLDVGYNDITSISNVSKLTNLERIDIACNAISDISALASLKKLQVLSAYSNTIKYLNPLSELSELRALIIASPEFTAENLAELKEMGANTKNLNNKNMIADLLPLINCNKLFLLDAQGNGIGDITPLLTLKDLAIVTLDNNYIDPLDVNNQAYLKTLQDQLNAAFNRADQESIELMENLGYTVVGEDVAEDLLGDQQVAYRPATNFAITNSADGPVLSWTAAEELSSPARTITGYQILRSLEENGRFEFVGSVDSRTTTSWTDKTTEDGKTYYYRVRAYKTTSSRTLTSACTQTLSYTDEPPVVNYSYGDLNGDGEITSGDALTALKASVGLITPEPELIMYYDVDGNGEITSSDALLILKYSVGLISRFPVEATPIPA